MIKKYLKLLLRAGTIGFMIIVFQWLMGFSETYPWLGSLVWGGLGGYLLLLVILRRRKKAKRAGIRFEVPQDYFIRAGISTAGLCVAAGVAAIWIKTGETPSPDVFAVAAFGLIAAFFGITHKPSGNIWISEGHLYAEGLVTDVRIPLSDIRAAEIDEAEIRIYAARDWFLYTPGFMVKKPLADQLEMLLKENGVELSRKKV